MGKCDWKFGNIFDYVNTIDDLVAPNTVKILLRPEKSISQSVYKINIPSMISSCYYVDKQYRTNAHTNDINEFAHGRTNISRELDVLFNNNFKYVEFTKSNASRCFTNFYTTSINYQLMNTIAQHFIQFKPHIERIQFKTLPQKYIAIHMRLGDQIGKKTTSTHTANITRNNLISWLLQNNKSKIPLIIMCDHTKHSILQVLEKIYPVYYAQNFINSEELRKYHKDPSVATFLLEKRICENASTFFGTQTSTVSVHIQYIRFLNNQSFTHYCNVQGGNFDKKSLQYKYIHPNKKWTWGKITYSQGHALSWSLFFPDVLLINDRK